MTTQELIQTYTITFSNKQHRFEPDPNYYVTKWPDTNNVLLTEFLYKWDNPIYIETKVLKKLENVLNENSDKDESGANHIYVEFTLTETDFYCEDSEVPDLTIPTQDFYDIIVLWRNFLLEPPLSGSQVEPETKHTSKLRSFFQFWRKP